MHFTLSQDCFCVFRSSGSLDSEGACTAGCVSYWTSIPLTFGWSADPEVKLITICPLALAVVVNCFTTAWFFAPAAAMMSKFVNTAVLLMLTLNTRCPTALQ